MLTLVLSVVIVYLVIGYVIGYRYYRQDNEYTTIDNMSWYFVVVPLFWLPMYVIVIVAFGTWK